MLLISSRVCTTFDLSSFLSPALAASPASGEGMSITVLPSGTLPLPSSSMPRSIAAMRSWSASLTDSDEDSAGVSWEPGLTASFEPPGLVGAAGLVPGCEAGLAGRAPGCGTVPEAPGRTGLGVVSRAGAFAGAAVAFTAASAAASFDPPGSGVPSAFAGSLSTFSRKSSGPTRIDAPS